MTTATRTRRRHRGQARYDVSEQPSSFKAILTRCYGSSYEHVYICGTVGGEQIDVSFQVPTIEEVHQHFNNPRKNGQTCVHGPYLLFRTFLSARMSEYATVKKQRGKISQIAKEIWAKAGEEIKDRFKKLAKETHAKFKREVPLIWVNATSAVEENSKKVNHSNNNEANVARDVIASTTVATMTTPTESVSDLAFPENQPTNNLGYELIPTELQNGVYFVVDVNTLQPDVYEQYMAEPVVQNTHGSYNYMPETQQVMDYSGPIYYIVENPYPGIDWSRIDEQSRHGL